MTSFSDRIASFRFRHFAWGLLGYNVLVMLWGAYVRASKSGDGCGASWPKCNGQFIPIAPQLKTLIEFGHRMSVAALLPLLILLFIWGRRAYVKGHIVRVGVGLCLFFTIIEALIGAGLVKYKLVAGNTSGYRVTALSAHLVNNLFLLTALTLTAFWASGGARLKLKGQGALGTMLYASLFGTVIMAVTGAIAALGDTLYPVDSLLEGIKHDFAADAAFILRHRPLHPLMAIVVTLGVLYMAQQAMQMRPTPEVQLRARRVQWLYIAQTVLGLINLGFLAPIGLQIAHLLLADLLWINLILFAASILVRQEQEQEAKSPANSRAEVTSLWPSKSPSTL